MIDKIELPNFRFALTEGLDDSFLPERTSPKATGWDVRAAEAVELEPLETVLIPLGFRCIAPEGWWFELKPRSSTFAKKQINCLYGTIDEDYRGMVKLACQWIPNTLMINTVKHLFIEINTVKHLFIEKGERIGQIIPVRRRDMIVSNISNEEFDMILAGSNIKRSVEGFGGSGNK